MSKKKRKRPAGDWQLPPSVDDARQTAAQWRDRERPRPPLPPRRVILGSAALFLTCCGMFLVFWLPPQQLVGDLRDRGVTVFAEVTDAPRDRYGAPGNIKVEFQASDGMVETVLSDFGGSRPDGLRAGEVVLVVYDPEEPERVLTAQWVENPPLMTTPMLVTGAVGLLLLAMTVAVALRRRWVLRNFGAGIVE